MDLFQKYNYGLNVRYYGEYFRSPAERCHEHYQDYVNQKEDSHMWKHKLLAHPDQNVTFTMVVLKNSRAHLKEWSWRAPTLPAIRGIIFSTQTQDLTGALSQG